VTAYCSQDALAAALPYQWPALADAAAGDDSVVEAGGLFDARHDRSDGQVSATRLSVSWPDFGLTRTPKADNCCALSSNVLAGQRLTCWPGEGAYISTDQQLAFEFLRAQIKR